MAEVEDEEFLSQVAAAEAEALIAATAFAKRRRISASGTTTIATTGGGTAAKLNVEEGAYIAALKGSKSVVYQQNTNSSYKAAHSNYNNNGSNNSNNWNSASGAGAGAGAGAGGSCFKCGKSGHWSRDCDSDRSIDGSISIPDKKCACGLGNCLVLTANTDKNRGRKFYKCPLRQENGGCGFFEWCDQPSTTDTVTTQGQSYSVNSSFPELACPCGSGTCLVLTAKTGKNIGQQFYRCPSNQGSCGFFKWCNDNTTKASFSNSGSGSQSYPKVDSTINKSHNSVTSSCFKCGNAGHWARDCVQSSSQHSAADGGVKVIPNSSTCFKCGKPGHWAKDCTF